MPELLGLRPSSVTWCLCALFAAENHESAAERHAHLAQGSLLRPGNRVKRAVDPGGRNAGEGWRTANGVLKQPHRQLHRTSPLKPVLLLDRSEAGLIQQRMESPAPIAPPMVVDDVVVGPKQLEGRNRDE